MSARATAQMEMNAKELLEELKDGTATELKDDAIICDCMGRNRQHRVIRFISARSSDNVKAIWALTPKYRVGRVREPAQANPISGNFDYGSFSPIVGACSGCNSVWAVLPWTTNNVETITPGSFIAMKFDTGGWEAGDTSQLMEVKEVGQGPAGSTIVGFSSPTIGEVQA